MKTLLRNTVCCVLAAFAVMAPLRAAFAGYYSAGGASSASPVSAIVPSSGGLHNVVVMSVGKCYAALGRQETYYIEMHYADPYTECMRRWKLKRLRDAAKKAAAEKTAAAGRKKESLAQKEIDMQKTSIGPAMSSGNDNSGGYFRVPQARRGGAAQQAPAAPVDPEQYYLSTHPAPLVVPPRKRDYARDYSGLNQ